MPHEPKKKHSKSVKRIRRSAIKLSPNILVVCKNCKQKTFSHMVCRNCGFYGGKQTWQVKQKAVVTRA